MTMNPEIDFMYTKNIMKSLYEIRGQKGSRRKRIGYYTKPNCPQAQQ